MKKLGIMIAAAMLFTGATAFAGTHTKAVKQETKKEAASQPRKTAKAHKAHKKQAATGEHAKAKPAEKKAQ